MKKIDMTESDLKTLIELWNGRISVRQICQVLPYKKGIVQRTIEALKANGTLVESNRITSKAYRVVIAYNNGIKDREVLSDIFNYNIHYITQILKNYGITFERKRGYKKKPSKINDTKAQIIEALRQGQRQTEVARQFVCSRQYVNQIYRQYIKEKENGI